MKKRPLGDIVIIMLVVTVVLTIVISGIGTITTKLLHPSYDIGFMVAHIMDIIMTILGVVVGYVAGRSQGRMDEMTQQLAVHDVVTRARVSRTRQHRRVVTTHVQGDHHGQRAG